jgi:hypothetical protein
MNDSGETWYVKLANGDVHKATVDQLDWAFEHGHIDANTLVLSEDADTWARLGEVAGLDEAPVAAPPPSPTMAPVRMAAPVAYYSPTPTPVAMTSSYTPAPRSVAQRAPYQAPAASSLRPVSMDLDDFDLNDVPFKTRSRKGWVVAVLSLAIMSGGVGLAARRAHWQAWQAIVAPPAPQAAAAPAPPPAETHVPYVTPAPAVAPAAPPAGDSPLNPRFTEAQKDQLLKADKKHEDKPKAHASVGGGHSASKYKSMGFTSGGNKYDPLNSTL